MTTPYEPVIDALRQQGFRAEFHRKHQLVLPARIWITWKGQWFISTWVPACYPVPADVDIVLLCEECLECDADPFYTIPAEICHRYRLERMSNDEFDQLFSDDDEGVDDSSNSNNNR